jgi:HlyD family secretion protein
MKPAVMPLSADALDFAPGLLSLQESPPAKLPRTVLYCVVALFAVLLAWASFGKLDIVASAEGRLVPQTYVKIVQPAEAGIVQDILVREGQSVEAGQILMRMDAKLTEADARTLRNEYELKRLQLRRIDAELAGLPMHAEASDAPEIYAQVASQYAAHRQADLDAVAQEQATLAKTRHDLQAAEELARKLRETVPTYRKSAAAFEKLGREGFLSPLAVEEKQRDRIEKEQDLRAQEATVASLKATLAASEKKLAQITSNERVETESQFRKLRDELEKIEYKAALLSLRAPQRGVIKDLATHTVGTVVSPGSVLMTLVPHGEPLQAEVYVKNEDVGFVHRDQRVKLKLSAYPFQKYGMIDGTVIHVGPDAADQPISSSKAGGDAPDAAVGLRYKALVRLDAQHLETDGNRLRLSSGMQVIAEIHQGQRTVMEYLLSPVQKAWQEAGRER